MSAHRYWRIYITYVTGVPHHDIMDIQFRTSIGGANVATGGTPIYSNQTSGFEASKAFDGSTSTCWYVNQGSFPLPQWIGYDFGAGNAKDIVEFTLQCWSPNENPSCFELQYSDDGTNWTRSILVESQVGWSGSEVRAYSANTGPSTAASKAFWRIRATAVDGGTVFGFAEMQMMTTAGGSTVTTGGTAYASCEFEGTAGSVFNSDISDHWNGARATDWIGYKFSSAKDIVQIKITARNDTFYAQSPKDFVVEYWDGTQYVTAWTVTGSSGWTSGQTRTFDKPLLPTGDATSSQAQSTSAAGGTAIAATNTTSQAQGASGTAIAQSIDSATAQGQAASGTASTNTDSSGVAAQGQGALASATSSVSGDSSTATAQGASGSASAFSTWSKARTNSYLASGSSITHSLPAQQADSGNQLVVAVAINSFADPVITVTDTAGNTYAEAVAAREVDLDQTNQRIYTFYALNITGHASNVITVALATAAYVDVQVQEFMSPASAQYDTGRAAQSTSSVDTLSTAAFNTAARGMLAGFEYNLGNDVIGGTFTTTGWATNPRPDGHNASGYRATTGAVTTSLMFSSSYSSRRLLSVVSLIDATSTSISGSTAQGQSSYGVAGDIESTAQTQQGQAASASCSVVADAAGSTGQAQAASAVGMAVGTGGAFTAQAQAIAASGAVSIDSVGTTIQAQQADAGAATGVDSMVDGSQGQTAQINVVVDVLMDVETIQAQSASGAAAARHVAIGSASQAQGSDAAGGVATNATGVAHQGQSTEAQAGTEVSAASATSQTQVVGGEVRPEADQSIATKQSQGMEGVLEVATIAVGATAQCQEAGAAVDTATDSAGETAQGQRMGQVLSLLHIVLDSDGSTEQAQGASATAPDPYVPQEGDLTARLTFREAVQARLDTLRPTTVIIRTESALGGRVKARPDL